MAQYALQRVFPKHERRASLDPGASIPYRNGMRTRIVILAAGKGTRMNGEIPKVLIPFEGKPMVQHLLAAVRSSGVDARPVIVTGYQADLVEKTLGDDYEYVRQDEQLGTGHAMQCTEKLLAGKTDQIIVLYGDHPFVKAVTIRDLLSLHEREGCPLSMMTVSVEDFNDWRAPFADFSRIIRDGSGRIIADAQVKDATPDQLAIREVNPAFFCFDAKWLWPHVKLLKNNNAKNEYYLTDLIDIAIREGDCIASMAIDARESMGLNTLAHVDIIKNLIPEEHH